MSASAPDHSHATSADDEGDAGSGSAVDRGAGVTGGEQDGDATNEGQSTTSPAEGDDEAAPPNAGSPQA